MNMKHPGEATATRPAGSTGTLMCPSGWHNDNPSVNSEENEDNVSNPLLKLRIKARSNGPDCINSADCGGC